MRALDAPGVMAGQQRLRTEFARQPEHVGELHRAVALDARHRRLPGGIAGGKAIDDCGAEPGLHVDDIMRDAEPLGDPAGVADIGPGAARAGFRRRRRALIVKLQGQPDDIAAGLGSQGGDNRGIDAARHGDGDPAAGEQGEIREHGRRDVSEHRAEVNLMANRR